MNRRYWIIFAVLVLVGCSQRDQLQPTQSNVWMVSDEREVRIGQEVAKEVEREFTVYNDPELTDYTNRVGQTLAKVSDRTNIEYHFKVLDSPIANAFAAPGGFIYVTRGMLSVFEDESEFGGVLGHEIGHVTARHGAKRIQNGTLAQIGLVAVAVLAGDKMSGDVFRAVDIAANLIFLGYSRADEDQADILGAKYLYRAGYDPDGMARAMEGLLELEDRDPMKVEQFFRSHPLTRDRVAHIRAWIPRIPKEDIWGGIPPQTKLVGRESYQRIAAPHAIYPGDGEIQATLENFRVGVVRKQVELLDKTISDNYKDEQGRDKSQYIAHFQNLFATTRSISYKMKNIETEPQKTGGAAKFDYTMEIRNKNTDEVITETGRAYVELEQPLVNVWKITAVRTVAAI